MKLVIQIPAFNEEAHLPATLAALPRSLTGVDVVEWLVVDDGSTDATAAVAAACGAHHVLRLPVNRGLARAFTAGLEASLEAGADVIVNLDADNQYDAGEIPALIAPILAGRADLVVGVRPIEELAHFSPLKRLLSRLGSRVVRLASRVDVPDAPSGFRALRRSTAQRIHVFSNYSYTLETIIQAGIKGMSVTTVPVSARATTRPSRLMRSVPEYIFHSTVTIVRIFVTYRPFRFFAFWAAVLTLAGAAALLPSAFALGSGRPLDLRSAAPGLLLCAAGGGLLTTAIVLDLVAANRMLLERLEWRLIRLEERLRPRRPDEPAR
jgi:glycosyltransferase involved in cell wall biosynthesis